jgi:NitT/TauT family transport system ATP-binding protein
MYENIPIFNDPNKRDSVELQKVSQSYDGGNHWVLKDLDLLIEDGSTAGKFVVILGASGCGKSTVLRYISGIQKPTAGTILINGKVASRQMPTSMVFQQYSSFPWLSVEENVALGLYYKGVPKEERTAKAKEMLRLVGLEGQGWKYAKYPTLSGGQLQRVAIARSLLTSPEVLLMDEPFGALDINTRLKMQDLLCDLWPKIKTTVIFVTHDISEAVYLADEIYLMRSNPGQMVKKIEINLPYERNRLLKREKSFIDQVYQVEDEMVALQNAMDNENARK